MMVRDGIVKEVEQRKSVNDGSRKERVTIIMLKRRCRAARTLVIEIRYDKMHWRHRNHRKMEA